MKGLAMAVVKSNRFLEPFRDLFDEDASDWFLGFDHAIERWTDQWDRIFRSNHESPKAHVDRISDHEYKIRMDVPGFEKKDLEIRTIGDELVIEGSRAEERKEGTSSTEKRESFSQSFYLGDGMKVTHAKLENGRLNVELECPVPPKPPETKIAIE